MDRSPNSVRRGSRRWKSANVPECRLGSGSASAVTKVNYGWLDGVDDVRCSSSSCGSNNSSSSSREALAPANATLVECATGTQQVLETVDEDLTLQIEDDAEDEGKDEVKLEEEEEEEENLEDYMDSFKYDSFDNREQQVSVHKPHEFPATEHPDSNKENDICGHAANPHRHSSLFSASQDTVTTAFSSLPRSLSKPGPELQDYDAPKLSNADGQEFRFHDFSSPQSKLTVLPKSQGVFKRSASLRCAIFPKLSKLKTVFKPRN